jgi:hypothetical protein
MSITESPPVTKPRPYKGRQRKYGPYNTAKPPTEAELDEQAQSGDDADRYSLFTPHQIEDETRNVRLDISFGDVVKIRDQAEMIAACMREIIGMTREHDLGSIRQRVLARREGQSLSRVLARFNGKCPRGDWKPKKK